VCLASQVENFGKIGGFGECGCCLDTLSLLLKTFFSIYFFKGYFMCMCFGDFVTFGQFL
jgi:hypothetical protein